MNKDFRVSVAFADHPKTKKLMRRCGDKACWCLLRFWGFVAVNKPSGNLSGMDVDDIEIAAGWDGEDGFFVKALLDLKMLEGEPGAFVVHDWMDHNGYAANAQSRSEKASKASAARWVGKTGNAQPCSEQCSEHEPSNAKPCSEQCPLPSPSPTPTPSPKEGNTLALPTRSEREFDFFWQAYPRKKSKGHAQKTWEKLRKSKQLPELSVILDAIAAAKAGQDWQRNGGQYIPHPGTWLNSSGWEDVQEIESTLPDKFAGAL